MENTIGNAFNQLINKLQGWLSAIIQSIPNLILAILVLITSYFLAKYISKVVTRLVDKRVSQKSISRVIGKISAIIVVATGLFLALGVMNLSKMLTSLLAGAGVVGLAIGLALQGTLSNTFAGIVISFRKKIKIGNWVETNGFSGEVVDINLKEFVLKEADNNLVVIPNKMVLDNPLKNYSLTTRMRVTLACGVGYESDLEEVERISKETITKSLHQINDTDEVEFFYTEFGGSSINYICRFWIDAESMLEKLKAKTKAIIEIKKAYDNAGINIPFPIRTLQFDNKLSINNNELSNQFSNN